MIIETTKSVAIPKNNRWITVVTIGCTKKILCQKIAPRNDGAVQLICLSYANHQRSAAFAPSVSQLEATFGPCASSLL